MRLHPRLRQSLSYAYAFRLVKHPAVQYIRSKIIPKWMFITLIHASRKSIQRHGHPGSNFWFAHMGIVTNLLVK